MFSTFVLRQDIYPPHTGHLVNAFSVFDSLGKKRRSKRPGEDYPPSFLSNSIWKFPEASLIFYVPSIVSAPNVYGTLSGKDRGSLCFWGQRDFTGRYSSEVRGISSRYSWEQSKARLSNFRKHSLMCYRLVCRTERNLSGKLCIIKYKVYWILNHLGWSHCIDLDDLFDFAKLWTLK